MLYAMTSCVYYLVSLDDVIWYIIWCTITMSLEQTVADSKVVVCILLKHCMKKEQSASAVVEKCSVEGEGTVHDSTLRKWFQRFKFEDTFPQVVHLSTTNDEILHHTVEDNPITSTQCLSVQLSPSQSIVGLHEIFHYHVLTTGRVFVNH